MTRQTTLTQTQGKREMKNFSAMNAAELIEMKKQIEAEINSRELVVPDGKTNREELESLGWEFNYSSKKGDFFKGGGKNLKVSAQGFAEIME
jgi:hypothetical protein